MLNCLGNKIYLSDMPKFYLMYLVYFAIDLPLFPNIHSKTMSSLGNQLGNLDTQSFILYYGSSEITKNEQVLF